MPSLESSPANKAVQHVRCDATVDAGHEYCNFTFYTSLAELYRRGEAARAVFVHIPGSPVKDEEMRQTRARNGVEVIVSAIGAMVDQLYGGPGLEERRGS